jgi:hypothetical protein
MLSQSLTEQPALFMTVRREVGKGRVLARRGREGVLPSRVARPARGAARDRSGLEEYGERLSGEPAGR